MWLDTSLSKNGVEKMAREDFIPGKVGVIGSMQLKHHSRKTQMRGVPGEIILVKGKKPRGHPSFFLLY